jgi:hypothetical protein
MYAGDFLLVLFLEINMQHAILGDGERQPKERKRERGSHKRFM